MRDTTALSTPTDRSAPESTAPPAQYDRVFGKITECGSGELGAREQDVELFDTTLALSPAPGPADAHESRRAEKTRRMRHASRSRSRESTSKPTRESQLGLSLPLLVSGALAAGIGLTLCFTSGPHRTSPDRVFLTVPDLPPPSATPKPQPSASTSATVNPPAAPRTSARNATPTAPKASSPASGRPAAPTPGAAPKQTEQPKQRKPPRLSPPQPEPPGKCLRLGNAGAEVVDLQRRLFQLSLFLGSADGQFGESVEVALRRYQVARNIPETPGVYGPLTRAALHAETRGSDRDGWNSRDSRDGRDGKADGCGHGGWN